MADTTHQPNNSHAVAPASLVSVDLRAAEAQQIADHGSDLNEVKEAMVDALLRMTEARCAGEGEYGEQIYAVRPSSKLVTGFLLPRFDRTGAEDETSDIHIATMGIDLQLAAAEIGEVVISPNLAVYIRELPDWHEISDPRNEMMPQVQLSRETRQLVAQRAHTYIQEGLCQFPPISEDDNQEHASDVVASAEEARIQSEIAEEAGIDDPDAQGTARATAKVAERAERAARIHKEANQQRALSRQERTATIATIRREAYDRAFNELGIRLVTAADVASNDRSITSEDLEEPTRNELIEAGVEAIETEDVAPQLPDVEENPEEGSQPGIGSVGPLRTGVGRIADHLAAPQPIPQKWRCLELDLGEIRFQLTDDSSRKTAVSEFTQRLRAQLDSTLSSWLATDAGQQNAYRPDERVLPSQFADEVSWNQFLFDLRSRRPATLADVLPNLTDVVLVADLGPDFVDSSRVNLRIAIENGASMPTGQDTSAYEHAVFRVGLRLTVPENVHRPLRLDRVERSYRFRDWLEYPAMGLNCGVLEVESPSGKTSVQTTWAPRYVQPRIDPQTIDDVPTSFEELADSSTDVNRLFALSGAYDRWIEEQSGSNVSSDVRALSQDEQETLARDLKAYRSESQYIREGIQVLQEARDAYIALSSSASLSDEEQEALRQRSIPWQAWLRANETFAAYGQDQFTDWRPFQLAFILAHIPTLASRISAFESKFDAFRDELSASLLYFPTGGGKSEAFFGLLVFNLFLDRLRGKARGVTALVRYPLRLLTLQQARRLTRILVRAELVRLHHRIGNWPFELGFWVGSGNTPNRVTQGFGGVPAVNIAVHQDDFTLLNPPDNSSAAAATARRRSERYKETLEAYDKLRTCPCCGSETGMRKFPAQHGRIGIVCFNDECDWNRFNTQTSDRVPLPFLLTDDTIYQRAPSVVLGTIDKLALIGQHDRTINAVVGMFGCARYMDPKSHHLFMPRGNRGLQKAEDDGWLRLCPAFVDGAQIFNDPFPSLIIQDEGHLLNESLGTFSGLFETTLERLFTSLGEGILEGQVPTWPSEKASNTPQIRLAKVIAATATISDPDRQLRVLYQREPLRFPCPGPNLYESFYSVARRSRLAERVAYAETLPEHKRPEEAAPWMRVYMSIMTNGRSHTMTTAAVVSAYHLNFTLLWELLKTGRAQVAVDRLINALKPNDPITPLRAQALTDISSCAHGANLLATLLDLLRISLTYVTNKKGGDQIIETLQAQVERDQRSENIIDLPFTTDLISGGVTIAEIQDVMARAEGGTAPGISFPSVGEALRNIVATSAISHGVDVEKFNAMVFAGLPSDIAEYIQASSRVGRNHVGFSLFVPTPHSRRDRYVVETHDQFHRFLERMISPPAVQRWADRAIRRIIPSIFQAYLCGIVEQENFAGLPDNEKGNARTFTTASAIKAWADKHRGGYPEAVRAVTNFALDAIRIDGRGDNGVGAATHLDHYRQFVEDCVRELLDIFVQRSDPSQLSRFWTSIETNTIRRPMTSLRDVDAGGVIMGATRDPYRRKNVNLETVRQVMKIIRGQRMAVRSELDAEPEPTDVND